MTSRLTQIYATIAVMFTAILAPAGAVAQSDALFSQYWALPSYYNPAAAGNSDSIKITAGAKMQWVGIPNAPVTFTGLADSPFKVFGKRIGAGIAFSQESIGLFSTINIGAQLAYKMKLLGGMLSIGVQVGLANQTFRGTEVFIPEGDDYHNSDDEAIPTNDIAGMAFDMAAGVFYTHRWFWASLSSTHLLQPTMTLKSENSQSSEGQYEFQMGRALYFMAGSNIPIKNTLFEIQPSMMLRTDFSSFTGDITARVRFKKFLSGGIGYRWNDAISIMVGGEYKNFFLGYCYDYPVSAISKASSGSHEVFLQYNVKLNLQDKNKNKHKSIRIM